MQRIKAQKVRARIGDVWGRGPCRRRAPVRRQDSAQREHRRDPVRRQDAGRGSKRCNSWDLLASRRSLQCPRAQCCHKLTEPEFEPSFTPVAAGCWTWNASSQVTCRFDYSCNTRRLKLRLYPCACGFIHNAKVPNSGWKSGASLILHENDLSWSPSPS